MLPTSSWIVGIGAILVVSVFVASEKAVIRTPVQNKITVIYWEKWTGQEGEAMRAIVDDYNKSQDKIFVKMLTISNVNDKTLLAASGGNPPDVAGLWGPQVVQFAEAGAALDLTDMATERGLTKSMYIPVYWDMMIVNNRVFGFPTTPATTALHVRRDLMPEDANEPEKFPKTIEDFDKLVNRISKKGPDGLKLAGFMPTEPGWWNWGWGYFFGGDLYDGKNLTINRKENIEGYRWMKTFADRFGPTAMQTFQSGFGTFSSPQNALIQGKVATELQGVWMGNYINMYKKDLNWFAVPFPYPEKHPELAGVSFAGFDVLMIPKGAKHPKEAFDFIAFVQSQKEMEKLCTSHGKNSPLTNVSEDFFNLHPNPYIRLFDKMARGKNIRHAPVLGVWPEINAEFDAVVQAINLGKQPDVALNEVQNRMQIALDRYRRFVAGTSE